ncbi:MAG TPA: homoserine kinase [Planctomycetes bacterium]|nr:homoserine kinase [Planctomycetota bacterium]
MSDGPSAKATGPASIGNCAAGFDVLGHSFAGPHDRVTVTRRDDAEVVIEAIHCSDAELPLDPERNTASRAVLELRRLAGANDIGFSIEIEKGIPLSSGMGGSAASAVAAVVATNQLLPKAQNTQTLYAAACAGEAAASGAPHGDNVGPSLLGGLVIAPRSGAPVSVPVPEWLHIGLVHPHCQLETRRSREVLQAPFDLAEITQQTEGLALLMAGCYSNDAELLRRGLYDVLAEPRRAPLIPGFALVKQAALDCLAVGASIGGGGPSVFGWFVNREDAERGVAAMQAAFASVSLASDCFVAPVAGPKAEVVE